MIDFACHCGHRYSLPDDMAGGMIQCPKCKRLVDVPQISDLAEMEQDGTIKIGDAASEPTVNRINELKRAFDKSKVDDYGQEYDLRPTMDDIRRKGADVTPADEFDRERAGAPKYDPITGELIRPMELSKERPPVDAIPVAKPALSYARGHAAADFVAPWNVPLTLFRPANLTVMGVIFLAHTIAPIFSFLGPISLLILIIGYLLLPFIILGHYSSVVEETGPFERNELPTPLRDLSFAEDIAFPFFRFFAPLAYCYFPAVIAARYLSLPSLMLLEIALGFLFPAAFLTAATSGTVFNLAPHRLWSVIRAIGFKYILLALLWIPISVFYLYSTRGINAYVANAVSLFSSSSNTPATPIWILYSILAACVYAMHLWCWMLGLCYRSYHDQFDWILQRHVSTKKPGAPPGSGISGPAGTPPIPRPKQNPRDRMTQIMPSRPVAEPPIPPEPRSTGGFDITPLDPM
jgi:hypothetical protein